MRYRRQKPVPHHFIAEVFEVRDDTSRTGRVAYLTFGRLPRAVEGCHWQQDHNFNIADELLHNPQMPIHYGLAITQGVALAEDS